MKFAVRILGLRERIAAAAVARLEASIRARVATTMPPADDPAFTNSSKDAAR